MVLQRKAFSNLVTVQMEKEVLEGVKNHINLKGGGEEKLNVLSIKLEVYGLYLLTVLTVDIGQ